MREYVIQNWEGSYEKYMEECEFFLMMDCDDPNAIKLPAYSTLTRISSIAKFYYDKIKGSGECVFEIYKAIGRFNEDGSVKVEGLIETIYAMTGVSASINTAHFMYKWGLFLYKYFYSDPMTVAAETYPIIAGRFIGGLARIAYSYVGGRKRRKLRKH